MTVISINGWALSVSWPRAGRMSLCSNGSHHFCEVMHAKASASAWLRAQGCHSSWHLHVGAFSQSFLHVTCKLKIRGSLNPSHPCANHPYLKMKVTNNPELLFILPAWPFFHLSIFLSPPWEGSAGVRWGVSHSHSLPSVMFYETTMPSGLGAFSTDERKTSVSFPTLSPFPSSLLSFLSSFLPPHPSLFFLSFLPSLPSSF